MAAPAPSSACGLLGITKLCALCIRLAVVREPNTHRRRRTPSAGVKQPPTRDQHSGDILAPLLHAGDHAAVRSDRERRHRALRSRPGESTLTRLLSLSLTSGRRSLPSLHFSSHANPKKSPDRSKPSFSSSLRRSATGTASGPSESRRRRPTCPSSRNCARAC